MPKAKKKEEVIEETKSFGKIQRFYDTDILSIDQQTKIAEWIQDADKQWEKQYGAKNKEYNVETFHTKCDGRGENVVVIKTTKNEIIGGYLSASWENNRNWIRAPQSFVFKMKQRQEKEEKEEGEENKENESKEVDTDEKYDILVNEKAAIGNKNVGPSFGHDLFIDNKPEGGVSKIGLSYDNKNGAKSLIENGRFEIDIIEVFTVKEKEEPQEEETGEEEET